MTKLMTVLLDARAHEASTTSSPSSRDAAAGRRVDGHLRAGERLTVRDLLEAALIQSANDAADALASYVGARQRGALRGDDEREGARSSACATRTSSGPTASTRPATLERARRDAPRAARDAPPDRPRRSSACGSRRSPAAASCTPGTTCSAATRACSASRRATPPAPAGTRSRPRTAAASRSTRRCSAARTRAHAQRRPRKLLAWGFSRYLVVQPVVQGARLRERSARLRPAAASSSSPPRPLGRSSASGRPLVERVIAPEARLAARVARGQSLGEVRVYQGGAPARAPPARRRALGRRARARRPRGLVRDAYPAPHGWVVLVIVTVTMNAAIDRTLTVPNFQLGHRHRASQGLTLAGGKGINIARALKRLGVPGRRDRARRRPHRHAHRRGADRARRSSTTSSASRTSRAPRRRSSTRPAARYTEINEWGPHVEPDELEILLEKLALPLARRRATSSSRARCRAASTTASTPRRSAT